MNNIQKSFHFLALLFFCVSCINHGDPENQPATGSLPRGTYAYDAEFLKKHNRKIIELKSEDGNAKILLSADYQGRVMTGTVEGQRRKLVRIRIFKTLLQYPKYTFGSPFQIESIWKEKKK